MPSPYLLFLSGIGMWIGMVVRVTRMGVGPGRGPTIGIAIVDRRMSMRMRMRGGERVSTGGKASASKPPRSYSSSSADDCGRVGGKEKVRIGAVAILVTIRRRRRRGGMAAMMVMAALGII